MKVAVEEKASKGWKVEPKKDMPGYLGTEKGFEKGKDIKEVEV